MNKIVILALVVVLAAILAFSGCTTQEGPATTPASEPVVLKAVTVWPENTPDNDKFWDWVDMVNNESGGRVTIEYMGGPEAIPQAEQVPSLQNGVFDVLQTAGAYYANIIPTALVLNASMLTPEQEREVGAYDILAKAHRDAGVVYLARTAAVAPVSYYWTNFPFTSLEAFKGKKFRSSWSNEQLIEEMGAAPVSLSAGEIYTSMERHLIDGFNQPIMGSISRAYYEVATHIVNQPLQQLPVVALVSLQTWEKLPKDVQDILMNTAIENESTVGAYYMNAHNTEMQQNIEKGMIFVDIPQQEKDWLIETSYGIYWDKIIEGDPVNGPRLKELTEKPK